MIDSFEINAPFFSGPIELLYSLIQKKSLDINDISLSLVTEDFLGYTKRYEKLGHEKISEFVEIVAQLLYLKSVKLLPFQEEEDLIDGDERMPLVERLIEYSKMKQGFLFLKEKQQHILYERQVNPFLKELKTRYQIQEVTLELLIKKIDPLMAELKTTSLSRGEITVLVQTVEERSLWVLKLLKGISKLSLFKLFKKLDWDDQIISFIAILELAKQNQAYLLQEETFQDIQILKSIS